MAPHPGCAVVVLHPYLGSVVPAAAVPLLRGAAAVFADDSVPRGLAASCGASPMPERDELDRMASSSPIVVLTLGAAGASSGAKLPGAAGASSGALLPGAAGASPGAEVVAGAVGVSPGAVLPGAAVITAAPPPGAELLAAVAVMDRLRSPGGCPWDAEQTHQSLRRFLLEETYELLDAIDAGDRSAFLEELGDVLLQVLFHARIAAEHPSVSFDIDAVASELVAKLIRRHPHVFAVDDTVHDASSQEARWEQLKAAEKNRTSIVDGVALGQPALSLVAALARRAARAGVPVSALANGNGVGEQLFAIAAQAAVSGEDPELALRAVAKRFASHLRTP